jgi:hypothetical protein
MNMRFVPLLAAVLVLPACIIVPPQNVCVVPTAAPGVNTGTTGSPAPGASGSPAASTTTTGGSTTTGGNTTPAASPTPVASPSPVGVASPAVALATTLRVTTTLPGDPRTLTLVPGTPIRLTATATDSNGNPIAGVTFRFDPDAGTSATAVTLDANGVTLPAPTLTPIAGTIRAVTPGGQVSADVDSIRVTAGL